MYIYTHMLFIHVQPQNTIGQSALKIRLLPCAGGALVGTRVLTQCVYMLLYLCIFGMCLHIFVDQSAQSVVKTNGTPPAVFQGN